MCSLVKADGFSCGPQRGCPAALRTRSKEGASVAHSAQKDAAVRPERGRHQSPWLAVLGSWARRSAEHSHSPWPGCWSAIRLTGCVPIRQRALGGGFGGHDDVEGNYPASDTTARPCHEQRFPPLEGWSRSSPGGLVTIEPLPTELCLLAPAAPAALTGTPALTALPGVGPLRPHRPPNGRAALCVTQFATPEVEESRNEQRHEDDRTNSNEEVHAAFHLSARQPLHHAPRKAVLPPARSSGRHHRTGPGRPDPPQRARNRAIFVAKGTQPVRALSGRRRPH